VNSKGRKSESNYQTHDLRLFQDNLVNSFQESSIMQQLSGQCNLLGWELDSENRVGPIAVFILARLHNSVDWVELRSICCELVTCFSMENLRSNDRQALRVLSEKFLEVTGCRQGRFSMLCVCGFVNQTLERDPV